MKKQTVYISGKITGEPIDEVRLKFFLAEIILESKGYKVFNPTKFNKEKPDKTWNDYMSVCLSELVHCDTIYMLKDWGQSRGARVEYATAKELGIKILFQGVCNE